MEYDCGGIDHFRGCRGLYWGLTPELDSVQRGGAANAPLLEADGIEPTVNPKSKT